MRASPPEPRRGVPLDSLVVLRVGFGTLLAIAAFRYLANHWIQAQLETPGFLFAYDGLTWIRPLPAPLMRGVVALMGCAGIAVALGWRFRAAVVIATVSLTYLHLCDRTNYLNHYYLVSLMGVLLALTPAHARWSLDARRAVSKPIRGMHRSLLWLLRAQVALVYLYAGIAKLDADWLVRGEPMHTWLATNEALPVLGAWMRAPSVAVAASWAACLFDLAIPWLLMSKRTWRIALVVAIGFHAATALLLPIGLFPAFMLVFATILLPADWPSQALRRASAEPAPTPHRLHPVATTAMVLWVLIQMLVPLRGYLEAGDVLWHERGFRWSWRVMLIDKSGHARFALHDPADGTRWEADPSAELTAVQIRHMATQPDMLWDYAQHLAAKERARGRPQIEVRVEARATLNGRPSTPLTDARLDVASYPTSQPPAGWVLPSPR